MGTARFAVLAVLFVFFPASTSVSNDEPPCVPGFKASMMVFKVDREHLNIGRILGKVGFDDCTDRKRFHFSSDDSHFKVDPDGTLTVKTAVTLYGHQDFSIHTLDSQRRRMTMRVRVMHHGHQHGSHHGNHSNGQELHQQHHAEVDSANNTEVVPSQGLPVIDFPKLLAGLKRKKRAWVRPRRIRIPTIRPPRNNYGYHRG